MNARLRYFAILSLLAAVTGFGFASLPHAQPTHDKQRATQPPGCVPGQQVACACIGGGSGVQRCNSDGAGFGACYGCAGQSDSSPMACDLAGAWQFTLSWQTPKCSWALDKTSFVVAQAGQGFSIEDKSDGVANRATIKAERTASGCALELVQSIDPEGAIAGSKSVSEDKYTYRLTASNGAITGSGKYQNFQFDEKPTCTGSFRVSGVRSGKGKR